MMKPLEMLGKRVKFVSKNTIEGMVVGVCYKLDGGVSYHVSIIGWDKGLTVSCAKEEIEILKG